MSATTVIYVVAYTEERRLAVPAPHRMPLDWVMDRAIEQWDSAPPESLGLLVEITECSDAADPSDPNYVSTIEHLKRNGKFREEKEPA